MIVIKYFKKLCCFVAAAISNETDADDVYGRSARMTNDELSENFYAAEEKNSNSVNHFAGKIVNNEKEIIPSEDFLVHQQGQHNAIHVNDQLEIADHRKFEEKYRIEGYQVLIQKLREKKDKISRISRRRRTRDENERMNEEDYKLNQFFQTSEEEWYSKNVFEYQYRSTIIEEDPDENMWCEELYRLVHGFELDTDSIDYDYEESEVDDHEYEVDDDEYEVDDDEYEEFDVDSDDGEDVGDLDDDEEDDDEGEIQPFGMGSFLIGDDKVIKMVFVFNFSLLFFIIKPRKEKIESDNIFIFKQKSSPSCPLLLSKPTVGSTLLHTSVSTGHENLDKKEPHR